MTSDATKSYESDVTIAARQRLAPIEEIAAPLGLGPDDLLRFGPHKAKLQRSTVKRLLETDQPRAPLVLVSATNPTPAGEGKTTCSIGLTQALRRLGKNATVVLREPSMGPVFGRKGGAAGGGYSQVLPMEDINLHFTGDMHAVAAANNLISAAIDNELYHQSSLLISAEGLWWRRVIDMNDRALRDIVVGKETSRRNPLRRTGFDIAAASQIQGILCLATSIPELKERISRIVLGLRGDGEPLTVRDLGIEGATAALLKDAMLPNLVQTLERGPAFVHGGPFANIAQGANSVLATRAALALSEVVVTEAGFGFDLGGEKYFDIVGPAGDTMPSLVVIVSTVRSLKMHGGVPVEALSEPDPNAVRRGGANLKKHLENVRTFGVEPIVAINRFPSDTEEELSAVASVADEAGALSNVVNVREAGGEGGLELASMVLARLEAKEGQAHSLYDRRDPVTTKIETIAQTIYGADGVDFTDQAKASLETIERFGFGELPVCMAKTQSSLSDDPALLGRPRGFRVTVRDVELASGSGFLVAVTGKMLRMPGLPVRPSAKDIDIDDEGQITGLF